MQTALPHNATQVIARAWFYQLIMDIGPGFHPDTDPEDYIDMETNKPLFSQQQAKEIKKSLETVFELLSDPYEIGQPVALNLMWDILE